MITRLSRRKSSGGKKNKPGREKKLLRWTKSTGGSMPGDSKLMLSIDAEDDVAKLVELYTQQLDFDPSLSTKILRKFRRHGNDIEAALRAQYKRYRGHEDAACLEDLIMGVLPQKNKLVCLHHLYAPLIRENQLFRSLAKAVPVDELESFEKQLVQNLTRENIACNRYLAVSPRGAVYVVRRGAVRVSLKGNVVATLERGSVFEVCVLSDQFVTIHNLADRRRGSVSSASEAGSLTPTNSAFSLVALDPLKKRKMSETKLNDDFYNDLNVHVVDDLDLTEDCEDCSEDEDSSDLESVILEDTLPSSDLGAPPRLRLGKRRSILNAFGLLPRRRESANDRRGSSLQMQSEKEVQAFPFSSINICAVGEDHPPIFEPDTGRVVKYSYGCELGVLSSDSLRAIMADHPSISRNLDVLTVAVEVQIEKETEIARKRQELNRSRLERELKQKLMDELESACRAGSIQRVQEAINAGASIEEPLGESGATALHIAAIFGHVEVVNLVLRLGANRSARDKEDRTALHLCCLVHPWDKDTCKQIIGQLVHHHTCLYERDRWGNTPVHLAASSGDLTLLAILMADINTTSNASSVLTLRNNDGYTPLELCNSLDSRRILKPKTNIGANTR
mmetsp:Transcript_18187/g.29551  ORF Transcript_18187/g.29551 Transcript_18187/m.29551 type:complete len:621 (-) Transcript_18187:1944-3806(-)|eukprot:CAMPEP_0203757790 /NCGR_PEP_ID=MMETSP0098-20131031/10681_1 /ASSEMBLY_ACC=CAM_ASM_000208 /TAXON_ID=96639 /ORGANISM=" , Strain NY0313808BC1" /LENGTH=620 /DNA_ID=CAMNT_0050650023 /DNA_START=339 /DNA_END=2201 /DNA_ORIENTATION=+